MLKVLETGPQATFQDLGRSGYSGLGVGPSGAFDRGAARRANRMLGNDDNAAVVEILFGGFQVTAQQAVRIVFTGTDADVFVDKRRMRTNPVLDIHKGQTVRLDVGTGLRAYLAVAGGFAVEPVLGSVARSNIHPLRSCRKHARPSRWCLGRARIGSQIPPSCLTRNSGSHLTPTGSV